MTDQSLCLLPPLPPAGCCDRTEAPPPVPNPPFNQPGHEVIAYRIGTFTTFRRAMLDRLTKLEAAATDLSRPRWREGRDGDFQTMLVELWAYLADVLTFYQERIANEAFLPTATQRDSLRRLAALVGYRPLPGAGAAGQVAFAVEAGKSVTVPPGFRVGSKAAPGKVAAVFETEAALAALGEHSAIPLSAVAPTRQFATLGAFASIFSAVLDDLSSLTLAASALYGTAGPTYLASFAFEAAPLASVSASAATSAALAFASSSSSFLVDDVVAGEAFFAATVSQFASFYAPVLDGVTRTVALKGTTTRLAAGDRVLAVVNEGDTAKEQARLFELTSVRADKAAGTTTVTWREQRGLVYDESTTPVRLYALRVSAGAFGSAAPPWNALSPTLNNSDGRTPAAPFAGKNWDDSANDAFYLPTEGDPTNGLFLDGVYDDVAGSTDPTNPSWAALVADGTSKVVHVADARAVSKAAYSTSAKVTRLTFGAGEALPTGALSARFPLRNTSVFAGSEPLALENNLPLPDPLAGKTLVLAGLFPKLQAGQAVVLRGNVFDPTSVPPSTEVAAEAGILDGPPALDVANGITTVTLKKALKNRYVRATTRLLANIVEVTQGETVRDEILGSGNGGAFQTFPLKKKPLTYLPSTDPEGLSAVENTLSVTVNGVTWDERPTLLESAPDDQVYAMTLDDVGQTAVVFGDGERGARPSTGRDNLRARYRKGLGESGNVGAGAVQQLIDSLTGVQKVENPQPTVGGAEMEQPEQIRINAPASVRTFARAVSADDYAALALSYPGVVKASATWLLRDPIALAALPLPYVRLTVAAAQRVPLTELGDFPLKLRAFLDRRRDPNVPLRIGDVTSVYVDVAARIDVDDRYGRQATLDAARAALNPGVNPNGSLGFFAFERLGFGESIHLSAVYAALQGVPGVRDALVTTLRRPGVDPDPATVRDHVFVRPTEIAVVANDPADGANQRGKLTLTLGEGGFVDT